MFTLLRLRVITDWRHAWKWSSMRFLALGGVIQGAIITTPDAVKEHVPEWVMQGMSCFALFCVIAAGVGRITTVEKADV